MGSDEACWRSEERSCSYWWKRGTFLLDLLSGGLHSSLTKSSLGIDLQGTVPRLLNMVNWIRGHLESNMPIEVFHYADELQDVVEQESLRAIGVTLRQVRSADPLQTNISSDLPLDVDRSKRSTDMIIARTVSRVRPEPVVFDLGHRPILTRALLPTGKALLQSSFEKFLYLDSVSISSPALQAQKLIS